MRELITTMLREYTATKLDEKDREILRRNYESRVNRAFLEVKSDSLLKVEAATKAAKEAARNASGGTLLGSLVGGLLGGASGLGDYYVALQANERIRQQAKGQEQQFMLERMAGEWELDREFINRLNDLTSKLIDALWKVLTKYGLSADLHISTSNLKDYQTFLTTKDTQSAIRIGKGLERLFANYAPFWFHLGAVYMEAKDLKSARECFERFEEINRPILRVDKYAAANARYKLFTLDVTETGEANRLLSIIEKNTATDDWNNTLFAALQHYQLGNKDKAIELLYHNIDLNYNKPLNEEILRQVKSDKIDIHGVQGIAIKDFKESRQLEELAESGNAEAQYQYGFALLANGATDKALRWFEKAKNQEHFLAKCMILFYYKTPEDKKDADKIIAELHKDAERGISDAQTMLACFYESGRIVEKNTKKAIYWYQKAADQGYARAQTNLGLMYERGDGVQKDFGKAVEWFQKAADQDDARAQNNLGVMYERGEGVQKDLKKAVEWYQKAAEQGHADAQTNLGTIYALGDGVQKDFGKAAGWYQKAAEQGDATAQNNLGMLYYEGHGVPKDVGKAKEFFSLAAKQGVETAKQNLEAITKGTSSSSSSSSREASSLWYEGVRAMAAKNRPRAREMWREACRKGSRPACIDLKKHFGE